jgi:hypothetical protein
MAMIYFDRWLDPKWRIERIESVFPNDCLVTSDSNHDEFLGICD